MRPLALFLASTLVVSPVAPASTTPSSPNDGRTAGPPWVSIEYPVNPYDQTTKGAFLVVHAFHHGTPTAFPVSGTAEGIVDGQRKSIQLTFESTSRTGVFALAKQWPSSGIWTLAIAVAQGPDDRVYAVVDLSPSGEVAAVRVPTRLQSGYTIPAPLAMNEIERSLRTRASQLANK